MSDDKQAWCSTHNRRDCPVCWPHAPRPASPTTEQPAQELSDEEMRAWGSYWKLLARMPPAGLADAAHRLFLEVDRRRRASVSHGALVGHMVSRFLGWRLPEDFRPDGGISFKATLNEHTTHPGRHEPTGTNLLDAIQAEAMVRYLIDGMPALAPPAQTQQGLSEEPDQVRAAPEDGVGFYVATMLRRSGEFILLLLERTANEGCNGFTCADCHSDPDVKYENWCAPCRAQEALYLGRRNQVLAPLNPDKQPSPSAAPAQEPKHTYACNSKMLADEDAGIRDRVCICPAQPASPEGVPLTREQFDALTPEEIRARYEASFSLPLDEGAKSVERARALIAKYEPLASPEPAPEGAPARIDSTCPACSTVLAVSVTRRPHGIAYPAGYSVGLAKAPAAPPLGTCELSVEPHEEGEHAEAYGDEPGECESCRNWQEAESSQALRAATPEGALREALAEIVTHSDPDRMREIAYAALAGQPAREQKKLVKEGVEAQRKCWHERCAQMVPIHKLWCSPCSAWVNDATAARPPECPCAERPLPSAQPAREDEPTEDVLVRDANGEVDMIASLRKGLEKRAAEDGQKALRAAALEEAAQHFDKLAEQSEKAAQLYVRANATGSTGERREARERYETLRNKVQYRSIAATIRALAGSPAGEGREDNQELLGKKGGE